jgi:hypothetical protein
MPRTGKTQGGFTDMFHHVQPQDMEFIGVATLEKKREEMDVQFL